MFFLLINWQNVSFPPLVFPYVRCVIIYITWFVCSLIALYVFWHFGNENDFPLKKTKTNKIIVLFSICRWGRVKKKKKFAFSVFFWQDSYTLISFSRRQYSPFVMCIRRCVNVWVDVIDWLNQFNNSAIFFSFATPKTRSHQAKRRKCEFPFRFSFDFFFWFVVLKITNRCVRMEKQNVTYYKSSSLFLVHDRKTHKLYTFPHIEQQQKENTLSIINQ